MVAIRSGSTYIHNYGIMCAAFVALYLCLWWCGVCVCVRACAYQFRSLFLVDDLINVVYSVFVRHAFNRFMYFIELKQMRHRLLYVNERINNINTFEHNAHAENQ